MSCILSGRKPLFQVGSRRTLALFLWLSVVLNRGIAYPVSEDAARNNENGVNALKRNNFRPAIEYLEKAYSMEPSSEIIKNNLSNAYNNYGLSLLKKGETLNAIDNFQRSLKVNPMNVYAMIDIAQAYYRNNNIKEAARFLESAYSMDPDVPGLKEFFDKVKSEAAVEADLNQSISSHFVISSDEDIGKENIANIKLALENAYSRVGLFMGYFPKEKIPVIIYSEIKYQKICAGKPYWAHASFDGKIRVPLADRIYSEEYLRKIIYHEFTHAVARELSRAKNPLWLSEGVSAYAEGFVEPKDRDFFRGYITRDTNLSTEIMPSSYSAIRTSRDANLCYREFYLAADFIIQRYGAGALCELMRGFASGKSADEALTACVGVNEAEFNKKLSMYVREKLGM